MLRSLTAVCVRPVFIYRHYLIYCVSYVLVCTTLIKVETFLSASSTSHKTIRSMSHNTEGRSPSTKLKCNKDDRQQVILLTYGRSGSSLTAEIIKQQKQVYVYYEPLHNLAKLFEPFQEEHQEVRHRYLHLTSIPEYNKKAEDIVERLMTCNYERLSKVASQNLHMRLYDSATMFWCIKRAANYTKEVKCLREGEAKCKEKSIQFLKIIRLTVQSVGQLMDRHPCLKLIYLVRDPRGSFMSKKRAFRFITDNATYEAERYCYRVNKDVDNALILHKKYPDRVYLTRYENIAEKPLETSRQLYQFLNLSFTNSVAEYIYNNTQAGFGDRRTYTLSRENSSEVCYAWRSRIKYVDVEVFDQLCSQVYYKLGYLPANSEKDLRNLHLSLKFEKQYIT